MKRHPFASTTFMMWGGLIIWAAQFLFAYVITALACARRFAHVQVFGANVVVLSVAVVSLLAILATLLVVRQALAPGSRVDDSNSDPNATFIRFITAAVGGFALLAIILVALPPLVTSPGCELR